MSLRVTHPRLGFIEPCLPSPAKAPPSGPSWLHKIKHDGFRIMARRDRAGGRFTVRASNGQAFRYIYFKDERDRGSATALFTRDEARHIADSVAQLPELWRKG